MLLLIACGTRGAKEGDALEQATLFFATRPEHETPLDVGTAPAGLPLLSAESCGSCHEAIYQQWKLSTHAAAWTDPQYQAEIRKSGNSWLCLNCHTPLLVQQEQWPVGLEEEDVERPVLIDNPAFDAELREEGITCVACHLQDGVIHGPGRSSGAPHPVQADERFSDNRICLRCHQAVAVYPNKRFVCTFDTGEEWGASPYAKEGTGCTDCHMPTTRGEIAPGVERDFRAHWWKGAGIPKEPGIHPPAEANQPGLDLQASWGPEELSLTATNANAGHKLPTGDPERWVQLDVVFVDEGGDELGRWSERIGQSWEWWPEVKKLGDNRLEPKETRSYAVPLPAGATGARISASSHRMTQEAIEYHELAGYPVSIVTHSLELP